MSSERKEIRAQFVELLKFKNALVGDRIFPNRIRPAFQSELPCILIYTKNESVTIANESPREYQRNLLLSIEIVAAADEKLDDTLDDISSDIEYWLHQDHTLGELVQDIILQSTETTIQTDGDTQVGSSILTYLTPYYTFATADENELDNFNTLDMKINMAGGPTGQIDSEDRIDMNS